MKNAATFSIQGSKISIWRVNSQFCVEQSLQKKKKIGILKKMKIHKFSFLITLIIIDELKTKKSRNVR